MPSQLYADLDTLFAPISADSATGFDIRKDSSPTPVYSIIRDARKAARDAERKNIFDGDNAAADEHWRKVLETAPMILKAHAKDLEVACWYSEALVRADGFAGLAYGFSVIDHLIEHYWEGLYPLPDEDGMETRVAPLAGLNGEGADGVLLSPMRSIHLTDDHPPGPYSFWQYKQALEVQRIADVGARAEQIAKNGFSLEDILKAVEQTNAAFYVALRSDLNTCLTTYKHIRGLLDTQCGAHHAPPTSNIIGLLEESLGVINHIAKNKLPTTAGTERMEPTHTSGAFKNEAMLSTCPIVNRSQALGQLQDIAHFFRTTEPHSPISYVIEKAIKWGDMSLDDLIEELIPDPQSRGVYSSLTGVKTKDI